MMSPTEKILLMNLVEHDLHEAFELLAIYNIQNDSEYKEEFDIIHKVYYRVYARSSHLRNEIMDEECVQNNVGCKECETRENAEAEEKPDRDLAHIMRLEREMRERDEAKEEAK